jgi:putative SOS response-associated peptidase YedK
VGTTVEIMCDRFALDVPPKKLTEVFNLSGELDFNPSWNIAPSTKIATTRADVDGSRHLNKMKWGLIPSWAKDASIGNKLANARDETVEFPMRWRFVQHQYELRLLASRLGHKF